MRAAILGAAAALVVGFVLDIGPWTALTGRLLGTAGAQEAPANTNNQTEDVLAQPSEADKAALRYFAREGDVERLEAELRRLRALYPNWTPPRDLLDPQGEDQELQRIYELVGEQRWEEAREAIAERRQRDPGWSPPQRLVELLQNEEARSALREASEAENHREVLRIAQENEQILTCLDPDSLWRVADAFAALGQPERAFDAYAYVIENCDPMDVRAASLQKAALNLDPEYVTRLFQLGEVDADGRSEFAEAQLDIIRGAVARGGERGGQPVPPEWLEVLAEFARTGQDLDDAMLIGYYLFRQGNPSEAAQWFRFALDNGLGAPAAEGYIVALRATGNREDEFLAREVAYLWREQTPELMEAYLDAMASALTADELGQRSIVDVEQDSVDRFVPVVIEQRDANGAQALGWYAFNTCQFIIAEEWFISSANWVPTEAAIYGLALARLRLGDQVGFEEVVAEWGPLYPSVRALGTPEEVRPEDPVTGDPDDPTEEIGLRSVICDPEERERLRQRLVEQEEMRQRQVSFTEAGSANLPRVAVKPLARRPDGMARPEIPRRSVVIQPQPVQRPSLLMKTQGVLTPPPPSGAAPQPEENGNGEEAGAPMPGLADDPATATPPLPTEDRSPAQTRTGVTADNEVRRRTIERNRETGARTAPPIRRRTTVVTGANRTSDRGGSTVRRRVRQGARSTSVDARVRSIVERPGGAATTGGGGGGGASAAQQALAAGNYSRCVAITDRGIRRGRLSAADANARGFCLLQLERPVEAAQAFQLARVRARANTNQDLDAVYGATLAAIANNLTDEAAVEATKAPLSRPRRTEVQISILTQRAIAANRDGRYIEALYYLDQRNKIAPLQKDLMLLQGFAYQNAGYPQAADRIFRAVNQAGPTRESQRALAVATERAFPPPTRSTIGLGGR
jgi:tetratricopeptide (TPR) repeat protein